MPLRLEKRAERSSAMALASPLIAIALTLAFGAAVYSALVLAFRVVSIEDLREALRT